MRNYEMEPRYKSPRRKSQKDSRQKSKNYETPEKIKKDLIKKIRVSTSHLIYTDEQQKALYVQWLYLSLEEKGTLVDVEKDFILRKVPNSKYKHYYRCTHVPTGMTSHYNDPPDGVDNHIHAILNTVTKLEDHLQDWQKLHKLDPAMTPQQFLYPNHQT
jgi:hypothetical protein